VNEKIFRKLVDEHYDRIFRAARFMCGDAAAAEDLVQETFLAAAESLKTFEGRSSTYTWLYGILLNKFRRWLRRKQATAISLQTMAGDEDHRGSEEILEADYPGPPETAERTEAIEQVRSAIGALTADHRSVITLRYIEGMSYEEIAHVLDCPIGTVKSRIHYALQKMANRLGEPQRARRPGWLPE
jgi:RNA polymerase sigma-70 factor (ECF subfamily)